MVKQASAGMIAHLAQEVTTLTTAWEIKRKDGKIFRFTNNSVDLLIEGELYNAEAGFERTAITNKSTLAVDTMDLDGFFTVNGLSEIELRNGLFDFSEVRFFLVNQEDTSQVLFLKRGVLGQIQFLAAGRFRVELRSLTQQIQQTIGVLSQATCRAQLGGPEQCRFPLQPEVILRSTEYARGDFVRVYTDTATQVILDVPVVDGDFESLAGWTTVEGDPALVTIRNGLGPFEGSNFLLGDTTSSPEGYVIRQDVDLTAIGGFSQSDLNSGFYLFEAQIRQAQPVDTVRDAGRVRINALNEDNEVIAELWNTKFTELPRGVWVAQSIADVIIPATTTQIRIFVEAGSINTDDICRAPAGALQISLRKPNL